MKNRHWLLAGAGALAAGYTGWKLLTPNRNYDLFDKVVLITGGSRGLGLELARQFAGEGAKIAICARNSDDLQRAREELLEGGADVLAVACDLMDRDQVNDMVQTVQEYFGRVDVLVNNAGTIEVGPMEVMTLDDYEESMKTHFWAPLYTIFAVLPEMKERGSGRIVNITSIGGKISVPHLLPYSASKFALVGLSEGLRAELAKDGIAVVTICPGLMRTGSPRNAIFKGKNRLEYAWFSISDSNPLFAMHSTRAARQIVRATRHGTAEKILTTQANLAARFHGLFPGLTADLMGIVNRLLPTAGGIGTARAKGHESFSALSPSVLTSLDETAARRNNEDAA